MHSPHDHPQSDGAFSKRNKPEVLVRAGKHYLCSSCGTLVEIPADVVGQLVVAVDPAPQDPPADPPTAEDVSPEEKPHRQPTRGFIAPAPCSAAGRTIGTEARTAASSTKTRRPIRPKRPPRASVTGELIDGLHVPSAEELDRALAWVSFHLRVLDRQGSELHRLKKLLKPRKEPSAPSRAPDRDARRKSALAASSPEFPTHAHEDVSMVSIPDEICGNDQANERGPP